MDTLPLEIVTHILSFISRVDTIQCALVCRSWHTRIPPCSAIHWHHICLDEASCSERLLLGPGGCCFSPYIKSISLAPGQCFVRLKQSLLLDLVGALGPQVEKLEIESPALQNDFVELFGQALCRTRVQSLTLENIPDLLDIPRLLAFCPTLRHLEYIIDPFSTHHHPVGSILDVAFDSSSSHNGVYHSGQSALESLTINAGNKYIFDLKSILRTCPDLWRIELAGFKRTVFCTEVLSYCPRLEILRLGEVRALVPSAWDSGREKTRGSARGLRSVFLGKGSNVDFDDLGTLVATYQATLETLYVTEHAGLHACFSSDLILGHLHTFAYVGDGSSVMTTTTARAAARLIQSSPCLVHIELHNCQITSGLVKALSEVRHLASLALSLSDMRDGHESARLLLQSLSSGHLKRLYYKDQGRAMNASILEAFTWIRTLESLTLDLAEPCAFDRATAVAWVKNLLGALADLQSLQLVGLDRISDAFLDAIAVHSVGSRLVSLCLRECALVTPEALDALASQHPTTSLRKVTVERCCGLRRKELIQNKGRIRFCV